MPFLDSKLGSQAKQVQEELSSIICKRLASVKVELPLFKGLRENVDIMYEQTLFKVFKGILDLINIKMSPV